MRRGARWADARTAKGRPVESQPLLTFKSHIAGKNADVHIFADRIEWGRTSTVMRRDHGSELILIRSISSVTTAKDGFRTKVTVVTSGNTIDFRVDKSLAMQVKDTLTRLMLGDHPVRANDPVPGYAPAQPPSPTTALRQAVPAAPNPPPSPGPPAPAVPAGWQLDPSGRFAHRYWDGTQWTASVATANGIQAVDPI